MQIYADGALPAGAAYAVFELTPQATTADQSPPETSQRAEITLGAVAMELARRGGIAQETGERDSSDVFRLGSDCTKHSTSKIDTLVFDGNALEVAIGAGLLDSLKAHFALRSRVSIT